MEMPSGSSETCKARETPEGVATLLEAGDLRIELTTVQEETFYDQNEEVVAYADGCWCNPGKSCC